MDDLIQSIRCHDVIIVEGKNDTLNLQRVLECETIEVNGYGVVDVLPELKSRSETDSLVVFTDSDRTGRHIRQMIHDEIPDIKDAELKIPPGRKRAVVEKATEEALIHALIQARARLTIELKILNRGERSETTIAPGQLPQTSSEEIDPAAA